ncbi:hypothetical protein DID88_006434 [Monilinia fructigena]|uniref:Major facilitator superfamily (MFS) profile domain-containing protein n=1 Tax=Monilinia fructigena TaxID=38457 RepID=A0A395ID84_9HELO|nr:hypothetical protein DID88_006434 [Monilinia fructigena]
MSEIPAKLHDEGVSDIDTEKGAATARPDHIGRRVTEWEAIQIAAAGDMETIDNEVQDLEAEVTARGKSRSDVFQLTFKDPRHYTWLLVAFASMGGLLSGIDQSLISGANLYMPKSLHLDTKQVSLVSSGVPLGAVGGALMLGPLNEAVGRKQAIVWSLFLYTVGAALEAGAVNFAMMMAGRVILGLGNLVSLYQFMIALGEVLGYVVAAIFVGVRSGGWRYMLGSSLVFSTIMLVGILFMPESPRFLMHKGRTADAWGVWKRIRGTDETARARKRFAWLDFFTVPRARRALIYANAMIFLGQFTGINAIQYYMATLMSQVGFDDKQAVFMSLVGGGALLIGTIPAILYMEKFGRRFLGNCYASRFLHRPSHYWMLILDSFIQQGWLAGTYITGLILYMKVSLDPMHVYLGYSI